MTDQGNFFLARRRDSELAIRMSGTWRLPEGLPSIDAVKEEIERSPHPRLVLFDTQELAGWDSSIVWFLTKLSELCHERGIAVDRDKLPKGLRRLVEIAEAVPEKKGARREFVAMPFLKRWHQRFRRYLVPYRDTQFSGRNGLYLPQARANDSPLPSRGLLSLPATERPPGAANCYSDQLSGGRHSRLYWGRAAAAIRRSDLCCRSRTMS
jgi:hypothetical protein